MPITYPSGIHPGDYEVALHESGHAVLGELAGISCEYITIRQQDGTTRCVYGAGDDRCRPLATLGGVVVDELLVGEREDWLADLLSNRPTGRPCVFCSTRNKCDVCRVWQMAIATAPGRAADQIRAWGRAVDELLARPGIQATIKAVALAVLRAGGRIEGDAIRRIIKEETQTRTMEGGGMVATAKLASRRFGGVYRLAGGMARAIEVTPKVDEAAVSATAVINTAAVDREGTVILPGGVDFTNYRKNPVVLWDHGMDPAINLPIGRSEHPDGTLAITQTPEQIEATCYFSQKYPEAMQIFALVAEGVIRATSIHVIPRDTRREVIGGRSVTVHSPSEMLEWSWGCIGVNPEAVARVLSRGRINGELLRPSVRRLLQPYTARRRGVPVGVAVKRLMESCQPTEAQRVERILEMQRQILAKITEVERKWGVSEDTPKG